MIVRRESVDLIAFGGLQIFDYTVGRDTRSSLAVVKVPPGAVHQESYSQRSEKYYFVVAGRVAFSLDGHEYYLIAGELCVVEQGLHFSCANRTQDAARLLLVHTPGFQTDSEVFFG